MSTQSKVRLRQSITTKLLIVVFSIYLFVTATLTGAHMATDYYTMRNTVVKDLQATTTTIDSGLAEAIWDKNHVQLQELVQDIQRIPYITGVSVQSSNFKPMNTGVLVTDSNISQQAVSLEIPEDAALQEQVLHASAPYFQWNLPLTYEHPTKGILKVGQVTLFSGRSVILERLRFEYLFIVGNALIKTLVLWVLFLWIGRRLLGRPLEELTEATRRLHLSRLDNSEVDLKISGNTELKLLEENYNKMVHRFLVARKGLRKQYEDLRNQVQTKSDELAYLNQQLKNAQRKATAFQQELNTAKEDKRLSMLELAADLRASLIQILDGVQLLREERWNSSRPEGLDMIELNGEYWLRMVNNQLNRSRLEARSLKYHPVDFDFPMMLEQLSELFQSMANQQGIGFMLEFDSELPAAAHGDAAKMRQVLINLVSHAIETTETGGVVLAVEYNQGQIRFQVEDSSAGMDPESLQTFLHLLNSPDSTQSIPEEVDLGLAIAYQLVRIMGCELKAWSAPGEGSVFCFEAPLTAIAGTQKVAEEPAAVIEPLPPPKSPLLQPPPLETLEAIYECAARGNTQGITEQTRRLELMSEQWRPLASEVRQLAQAEKIREIRELVRPLME